MSDKLPFTGKTCTCGEGHLFAKPRGGGIRSGICGSCGGGFVECDAAPMPPRPLTEIEDRELTGEEWRAVPFGEVRIAHGFPRDRKPLNQTITVYVEDRPVARLAVTEIGFERSYGNKLGHITLKLIAGDCLILSSRPRLPSDRPQQDSAVQAAAKPSPGHDEEPLTTEGSSPPSPGAVPGAGSPA